MQTIERIRPPTIKGPSRVIQKLVHNPLVEKRIDMALKEYRYQLKKHDSRGPSVFYGSERFRKSRRYKQTMSIFAGVVEYLAEEKHLHTSRIIWEQLVHDWFTAVFDHYVNKWGRCPLPMQVSPTNKVIMIFVIFTQRFSERYDGEVDYWARKPDARTPDKRLTEAQEHRKNEVAALHRISPLWTKERVLADLHRRFGPHVKSIADYIENGGLLDDKGRRQPAEWV